MKKSLLLLFAAAKISTLFAQAELLDEVLKNRENTAWLVKWNAAALLPEHSVSYFNAQFPAQYSSFFEIKKPPLAFTAEASVARNFSLQLSLAVFPKPDQYRLFLLESAIEARRYLGFVQADRQARRGANFSGFYAGLRFSRLQIFAKTAANDFFGSFPNVLENIATARLGFQTRLLRGGFVDWSLGFGRRAERFFATVYSTEYFTDKRFHFDPRLAFGLAMGDFSKAKTAAAARDHFFQKHEKRLVAVKFDLLRIARPVGVDIWSGRPSIEAEVKFGQSAVSAVAEFAAPYETARKIIAPGFHERTTIFGFAPAVELRWYFSQSIWQQANRKNLNGVFLAANYTRELQFLPNDFRQSYRRTTVLVGAQAQVGGRGFVQYKLGLGSTGQDIWQGSNPAWKDRFGSKHLLSELKAGFVF